jgi:uncharacterized membrane protein YeaQ/YmgE (transglycosylase-associated protein family)
MFSILIWVVFGFIAGGVAEWIFPPAQPHSKLKTIAIGAAGSVVGGIAASVVTGDYYHPAGLLASIAGAVLVMYAWKKFNEVAP